MNKPDIAKIIAKEAAIIVSCVAMGFGIGRIWIFNHDIHKGFISVKLAGILYIASIAFRLAGLFIRITFKAAFIIGFIAVILLILAARYPAIFAFLK